MMDRTKALLLATGCTGILLVGYFLFFYNNPQKEILPIEEIKNEVLTSIKNSNTYNLETSNWIDNLNEDVVIGYLEPHKDEDSTELNNEFDPKKDMVKFFITGITDNNIDVFLSSYDIETISQDLFQSDEVDKSKVVKDIINQISRNGILKEVIYQEEKGLFGADSNETLLTFIYEDNEEVNITILTKRIADEHHENESVYVITTSVWDIINQIKTAL